MSEFDDMLALSFGIQTIATRCSNEMYLEMFRRAEMEGKNRSEYIRAAILFYMKFSPPGNVYHARRDVRPKMYEDSQTIQELYENEYNSRD